MGLRKPQESTYNLSYNLACLLTSDVGEVLRIQKAAERDVFPGSTHQYLSHRSS